MEQQVFLTLEMADRAALLLLFRVTLVRSPVVALVRVYFSRCRLQAMLPSALRPKPINIRVDGSGTASSCPRGARPSSRLGKPVWTAPFDAQAICVLMSMPGSFRIVGREASVKPGGVEMKKSNVSVRGLVK